jgi:hypothetical protein
VGDPVVIAKVTGKPLDDTAATEYEPNGRGINGGDVVNAIVCGAATTVTVFVTAVAAR